MDIPERCLRCDNFDHDNQICPLASPPPTTDDRTAIAAVFSWGTPALPRPHLTFIFHPEIHSDNIKQIAEVMAQTAARKMDCLNLCAFEQEQADGYSGRA